MRCLGCRLFENENKQKRHVESVFLSWEFHSTITTPWAFSLHTFLASPVITIRFQTQCNLKLLLFLWCVAVEGQ